MKIHNRLRIAFPLSGKLIFIAFCAVFLTVQVFANPGRLDLTFQNVLADGAVVSAIEVQPDGKIIIGGNFTTRGAIPRQNLARLNPDGSVDATFAAGNSLVFVIKLQEDGKILIGGGGGGLKRINVDGSNDAAFNVTGINITIVFDLDIQADGKIIVSAMNGAGTSFVTRLNTDGSVAPFGGSMPTFHSCNNGLNYRISYVPIDNKILIGCQFPFQGGTTLKNLMRINLDGTIDPTFTATIINSQSSQFLINPEPLGNGKILVWGKFDTVNQTTRRNVALLNSDGSVDTSFNPATNGLESITSVAVQRDGKIVIGGSGFGFNTFVRGNVARLNQDGSADYSFNTGKGTNGEVRALKIQNGNKLLIGGSFFRFNGFPRRGLARVNLF